MNRIDRLIADMCPNGVEFKELAIVTTKGKNIKWVNTNGESFQYIDLTSVDRVTRKISNTASITSTTSPSRAQQLVLKGDVIFATTRPTQMRLAVINDEYDGQVASTGYCVLRPIQSEVLTNFLAHLLSTEDFRRYVEEKQVPGNYPSIPDSLIRAYRIPVPPLEIQREIVKILDTFTQLEAELEAELEARKQQYRHYRDQLLSFEGRENVKWVKLGEFAHLVRGNGLPKSDFVESGIGAIHYGQIYTHFGTWAIRTKSFVTAETAAKLAKVDPGDIVITNTSENIEDVGKAVAWIGTEQVVTGGHATVIKHNQNPKFIAYCFQTEWFYQSKRKLAIGTKVIDVSAKSLAKIEMPVPTLEEQASIVSILDRFDALVNDLSSGLPAEIQARRRQYEYYRDRLLSFKEAG